MGEEIVMPYHSLIVTPAKAGAHLRAARQGGQCGRWVPAFAGMTEVLP